VVQGGTGAGEFGLSNKVGACVACYPVINTNSYKYKTMWSTPCFFKSKQASIEQGGESASNDKNKRTPVLQPAADVAAPISSLSCLFNNTR